MLAALPRSMLCHQLLVSSIEVLHTLSLGEGRKVGAQHHSQILILEGEVTLAIEGILMPSIACACRHVTSFAVCLGTTHKRVLCVLPRQTTGPPLTFLACGCLCLFPAFVCFLPLSVSCLCHGLTRLVLPPCLPAICNIYRHCNIL